MPAEFHDFTGEELLQTPNRNALAATICIGLLKNSRELMARWVINSVPRLYLELQDKPDVC